MKRPKFPRPDVEFDIPLYGGRVYVYFDRPRWDQARSHMLKDTAGETINPKANGLVAWMENTDGSRVHLVGVFNKRMGTLVHELGHVAIDVCEGAGIDPTSSNGEPFCYLLDGLWDRVEEPFAKHIMAN